jgi:hypothetical protein
LHGVAPAKAAAKPMTIHLPAGRYELQIAAEHHRTDKRRFDAHADVALRSEGEVVPSRPPVRVGLSSGDQAVTLELPAP